MIFVGNTEEEDGTTDVFLFCVQDELEVCKSLTSKIPEKDDDIANDLNNDNVPAEGKTSLPTENPVDDKSNKNSDSNECPFNVNVGKSPNSNENEVPGHDDNECSNNGKAGSEYSSSPEGNESLPFSVQSNDKRKSDEWNDYECYKISQEDFFPTKVMNLNTQKLVITRFLNFYVGGRVPKGLWVTDILFAVIALIPLTENSEKFIWHKKEYSNLGTLFFLTPEERLGMEIEKIIAKSNETRNNETKEAIDNKQFSDIPREEEQQRNEVEKNSEEKETGNDNIDSSNSSASDDINDGFSTLLYGLSIKWHGNMNFTQNTSKKLMQKSPVDNSAFITYCNKLLSTWDESVSSRIRLKYFFGIIALTLMQGIIKGKNNLMFIFSQEKFQSRISFIKSLIDVDYLCPSEGCVYKCCREFRTRERSHMIMFAKVLFNKFRIEHMYVKNITSPSFGLYNIFRMCIVDHLAYYDMGIINLLKTIYRTTGPGSSFFVIVEELQSDEIDVCFKQVRLYLKKYLMNKKSTCYTHHWARFFDEKQFEYLSCRKSYAAAVVLSLFIEKMTANSGIWRSGWVKTQNEDLEKYKQLGTRLYKQYIHLRDSKKSELCQFFSLK
ncbi:uncharacterized protein [Battus philenor]|uniref:uncharacterized protein n=1 Tax=Battus philenor TaxID=42288 RepID=UPI0035CFB659